MLRIVPFALAASIWILPSAAGQTLQPWDEGALLPVLLLILSLGCAGFFAARSPQKATTVAAWSALGFVAGTLLWFVGFLLITGFRLDSPEVLPFATGFVAFWSVYGMTAWAVAWIGRTIGGRRVEATA